MTEPASEGGGIVGAVILAAGASSRMGRPKALLALPSGETFLARLCSTAQAAGVREVVVVVGHHADLVAIHADALRLPARVVRNPEPHRGQLSSLVVGLEMLERRGCDVALVFPVDQPLVLPTTVTAVLEKWRGARAAIVRPLRADGRHGHPALIERRVWDDLRRADPSVGARPVITAWQPDSADVEIADPGAFEDVDTPEDYERLLRDHH